MTTSIQKPLHQKVTDSFAVTAIFSQEIATLENKLLRLQLALCASKSYQSMQFEHSKLKSKHAFKKAIKST